LVTDRHIFALRKRVRHWTSKGRQYDDLDAEVAAKQLHPGTSRRKIALKLHKSDHVGPQDRRVDTLSNYPVPQPAITAQPQFMSTAANRERAASPGPHYLSFCWVAHEGSPIWSSNGFPS